MVIVFCVQAYLVVGALVALVVHISASRLAAAHPDRLCRWCQQQHAHLVRVVGPLLEAHGPAAWALVLVITMLAWPRTAAPAVRRLRHTCPTPHLGGTRRE